MAKKFKILDITAGVLAVVGAINWGFEVLNFNLVEKLSALLGMNWVSTVIYVLVGLSGLWIAVRSLMGKYMRR